MRTLKAIAEHFPTTREEGLTDAQAAESRAKFGANRLTPLPRESVWKKFLEKFDEPIIKILLAASLLKIVVDLFGGHPLLGAAGLLAVLAVVIALPLLKKADQLPSSLFALALLLVGVSMAVGAPSYEGLAVMIAVVLATGVSFLSEYRSDREFEKLNDRKDSLRVKLIRNGAVRSAELEEIVVGDWISLETGDEIAADGRVVWTSELFLDQSLMTGESEPVPKFPPADETLPDGPDQSGCVYRGTQVVEGAGRMVATNVGDDTMLGQIARRLSGERPEDADEGRVHRKLSFAKETTPLQGKLEVLAGLISRVGYVASVLIFLALLVRGAFVAEPREVFVPHTSAEALAVVGHLLEYFVYMVIVIVVAVPEGLPMSVTVSLALAMRKMTRANSLVRQLVACETIGSATVICSDKTGTLTQNKMRVECLGVDGQLLEGPAARPVLREAMTPLPAVPGAMPWLALNAALNSTAALEEKEGRTVVVGNSTEGALLFWLNETGLDWNAMRKATPALFRVAFSSEQKQMKTVVRVGERMLLLVKGAPEVLLALSTHYVDTNGVIRELTESMRDSARRQLAASAERAMRTLAFAHAELPANFPTDEEGIHARRGEFDRDLIFEGFAGIRDPLRDDVKEAVAQCREAGIEVKMITGDSLETARAIGREVGLMDRPGSLALTSEEFNRLSDDELKMQMPNLRILARAKPLDKYRMVKLLQEQEHVVAMTGDGTNDAPSLKKADVGLAMGISGTEVAKEASKIVLLDDAFSTIVRAVHWGRALYENIQRFIQFQLTINVSALTIAFLGPFLGLKPPFTVLQLLWINVIMDTFAAIALCSERPRPGLMKLPPKKRHENILTRAMIGNILVTALFFVVVMVVLLLGMQHHAWFAGGGERAHDFPELTYRQVTVFFTVYVLFQVWNQINCRALTPQESGFARLFSNPQFLGIALLTVVGQVLIVTFGGHLFEVEPLTVFDWLAISAATSSVLLFAEISRRIRKAF